MSDKDARTVQGDPAHQESPPDEENILKMNRQFEALSGEVRSLRELLERLRLQQYVRAVLNVRRIAWVSFLSGILNGLGAVIGATLILALVVYVLSRLEVVPHIGRFISEIVKIVQQQKP